MKLTWIVLLGAVLAAADPAVAQDCARAQVSFDQANRLGGSQAELLRKEELYRKTIELCPSHGEAHNNLGDVYERQGRFDEAIAEYTESARLTRDAIPNFGVADVYFKTNRPKEALEWYEKGLQIAPGDTMSTERAAICRDLIAKSVVSADTIVAMLTPDRVATRGPGEVVAISFGEGLIPFDFDSAAILPRARPQLDELGKALKTMPNAVMEIAGHTDARGDDAYNLALAQRRASAVSAYLTQAFAIPGERLVAKGYGERVPICTTDQSEACHALNRRVEVVRSSLSAAPRPTATPPGAPTAAPAPKPAPTPAPAAARPTPAAAPAKPAAADKPKADPAPPAPAAFQVEHIRTRGASEPSSFRESGEPPLVADVGFFSRTGPDRIARLKDDDRLRSKVDSYFIYFRPAQDCFAYLLQEDSAGKISLLFPSGTPSSRVQQGTDYWVPSFGSAYSLDEVTGIETLYLVTTAWPLEQDLEGLTLAQRVQNAIPGLTRSPIVRVVPPSAPETVSAADVKRDPRTLNALIENVKGQGGWVLTLKFKHE